MIKHLTLSALTGGALVLAYAAWSKWRATPPALDATEPPRIDPAPPAQSVATEPSIDVILDDLWAADETTANPDEQLVDFSAELADDEDDGSVAPEGLGVRWLTRATEAMSPFHHALSIREEAEAALLDDVTRRAEPDTAPESSSDLDLDLDFEDETATPAKSEYQPEKRH